MTDAERERIAEIEEQARALFNRSGYTSARKIADDLKALREETR